MPVLSERIVLKDATCPVIRFDMARRSDKTVGFSVSMGLHVLIFIVVGAVLVKPPEFVVESGIGRIDVDLIAAEPESSEKSSEQLPTVPVIRQENDFIQKEEFKPVKKMTGMTAAFKSKEQVLIQSTGGAITEAKPDYFRNPAPAYPDLARRQRQEGTVILLAFLDTEGNALRVEIDQSSGHALLDKAAMRAVKKWRFRPAMFGGIYVRTTVRVPIRFDLLR